MEPSPAQQPATETAPNGWPWSVLRGFRDGAREALTQVYRMHAQEVARFLRHGFSFRSKTNVHRFVGYASGFDLQDALHETFRRAFEPGARTSYDGLRPYGPYLRAIARNVVLRSFRAREVLFPVEGQAGSDEAIVELADHEAVAPEETVAREQIRRTVQTFLDGLDEADRRLLALRFVEGKSQRDAAEELGIGRQRVRGREDKLRARLLEHLRRRGETGLVTASLALPLVGIDLILRLAEALR